MPGTELFVLRWLDETGGELPSVPYEYIVKDTLQEALRNVARRFLQSPHLIPDDVTGFFLCTEKVDKELRPRN